MEKRDDIKDYTCNENTYSDFLSEPQMDLFFENGSNEHNVDGNIRILSLFAGCGGMDLGLEGGFICHKKSSANKDYIKQEITDDWVLLKKTPFKTVFACEFLP